MALAALLVLVQHDGGLAFDGHAYWLAGRAVLDGQPLYAPAQIDTLGAYLYPPLFAQLWAPFAALPELAFDWLWRLVCIGCLRYLAGSWRNVGLWCLLPLTWREVSIANVTFPVAAAVLLAFRGRGQGLLMAGILKFGALLAVPYLWFARPQMRRTLVVGAAVAVGVCAASFVVGPGDWFDYARSLGWRASSATSADLLIAILPTASADFVLRFVLGAALVGRAAGGLDALVRPGGVRGDGARVADDVRLAPGDAAAAAAARRRAGRRGRRVVAGGRGDAGRHRAHRRPRPPIPPSRVGA